MADTIPNNAGDMRFGGRFELQLDMVLRVEGYFGVQRHTAAAEVGAAAWRYGLSSALANTDLNRQLFMVSAPPACVYGGWRHRSWSIGHSCVSKFSCATRLKARAATLLSRRGTVRSHSQWEQHHPLKRSSSIQIMRLAMRKPFLDVGFGVELGLEARDINRDEREVERRKVT
jgi:hypothetical protein